MNGNSTRNEWLRQDQAISVGESVVLAIDKAAYERIRAETVKSEAEQKIDFLIRYVPKLRISPRSIIEELDILFVKECYTKGYKIIREGDFNENVYFMKAGTCRSLQSLSGPLTGIKSQLNAEEQSRYKQLIVSTLSNLGSSANTL